MSGRSMLRGPGAAWRFVVVVAAVLLAVFVIGLLVWALTTGSPDRLAWLTSISAVLAVVLTGLGMSVAMLARAVRHDESPALPDAEGAPETGDLLPVTGRCWSLEQLDPFDLEVHRSVGSDAGQVLPTLPAYVPRAHDERLRQIAAEAAAGASRLAVLVGRSSPGKTRACCEPQSILRRQDPAWQLWHPIAPTRSDAALAGLDSVQPRTVIWLNEAQLYLGTEGGAGEEITAGLRELLRNPGKAPVLVLAALWPSHWDMLTSRSEPDSHAQARELLSGRNIDVPERFSPAEMALWAVKAHNDARLAEAAVKADDGRVTQYLAGVPILLDRYRQAPRAAQALIHAATDARRMGCGQDLPVTLLSSAASGYLTQSEWDGLEGNWLDSALRYLSRPCNGIPGPLTLIRPRGLGTRRHDDGQPCDGSEVPSSCRLTDYLDEYCRREREKLIPPQAFWAAATMANTQDMRALAEAAQSRDLLHAAARIWKHAATKDAWAAIRFIEIMGRCSPNDQRPHRWAAERAPLDDPLLVCILIYCLLDDRQAEQVTALIARSPAAHVAIDNPGSVGGLLASFQKAGAHEQINVLLARDPATSAAVDPLDRPRSVVSYHYPDGVTRLLRELRAVSAHQQVSILADRVTAHAPLNEPDKIATLLTGFREAGANEQVTTLADRAAAHVPLNEPDKIAKLLDGLRKAEAREQITVLLARNHATHASLDDLDHVMTLTETLHRMDAEQQAMALAERAVNAFALDEQIVRLDLCYAMLRAFLRNPSILDDSRSSAAGKDARAPRRGTTPAQPSAIPRYGEDEPRDSLYRFGYWPDGTPASPWGWDELN